MKYNAVKRLWIQVWYILKAKIDRTNRILVDFVKNISLILIHISSEQKFQARTESYVFTLGYS